MVVRVAAWLDIYLSISPFSVGNLGVRACVGVCVCVASSELDCVMYVSWARSDMEMSHGYSSSRVLDACGRQLRPTCD